ncbi:MAG: hypothetical protein NTY19_26970 [Planctomycetota bacterium]|nr:hypothetical protein [Planctomycetota bacterium]
MRPLAVLSLVVGGWGAAALASAAEPDPQQVAACQAYQKVVAATAAMVSDPAAGWLAMKHGLQVLNVTWEDTARYYNSAVGPNISDMTIQVQQRDLRSGEYALTCMPVIRFPNFSDLTGDVPLEQFQLLVGNQQGESLQKISLREFLGGLRKYLTKSDSWVGEATSLLAPRDTHVLVSAQACFLPIPREGVAEFNPVLFNYQSQQDDPAVLTILATREGTSVTVIDNQRDRFQAGSTWGQRLFFNQRGERASLTGQRQSDFNAEHRGEASTQRPTAEAAGETGLNMVLLIQVPLKQKHPLRAGGFGGGMGGLGGMGMGGGLAPAASDVEEAVIGHGKVEGPFTEIAGLPVRRDPKYPIRVTVQFYKATSNGVVSEDDLEQIASQINRVYKDATYVGSLVVGGPSTRPTEFKGYKVQPPWWWDSFWKRHQRNTGQTPAETMQMLDKLLGPSWYPQTHQEMLEAVRQVSDGTVKKPSDFPPAQPVPAP